MAGAADLQPLLWQFGSTLEEIAHAQETLAHTLTQSFILPLETFCSKEMDKVGRLCTYLPPACLPADVPAGLHLLAGTGAGASVPAGEERLHRGAGQVPARLVRQGLQGRLRGLGAGAKGAGGESRDRQAGHDVLGKRRRGAGRQELGQPGL